MTVKDVAELLNFNERKVTDMVKAGELPYTMFGKSYRFNREQIEAISRGETLSAPAPEDIDDILRERTELEEVDYQIKVANKRKELAEINGSLISKEELDEALEGLVKREADIVSREHAVDLANGDTYKQKEEAIKEVDAKRQAFIDKYGTVDKLEATVAELEAKDVLCNDKLAERGKSEAEAEDLIRIIQLLVPKYCGYEVWKAVGTEINRIVADRLKNKKLGQPIETR